MEYYKRKFARLKSLDVGRNACIGRVGQGDWNIFFEDIRNADQQRQQKGYQRMWLIFSHVWTWNDVDEQRLIVTIAGRHAKIIDKVQAPARRRICWSRWPIPRRRKLPIRLQCRRCPTG